MLATGRIYGRPPLASLRPSYELKALRRDRSLTLVNYQPINSFDSECIWPFDRWQTLHLSVRLRCAKLIRELRRHRGVVVHLLFIAVARSTGISWVNN